MLLLDTSRAMEPSHQKETLLAEDCTAHQRISIVNTSKMASLLSPCVPPSEGDMETMAGLAILHFDCAGQTLQGVPSEDTSTTHLLVVISHSQLAEEMAHVHGS
mmetsp:Transcript_81533/g.141650  ORF Transcript_81533/g.141650 Transcript_81533/m.141650 type:complete len:104 (-) Transcript_81533:99-410(-)